MAILKLSEIIEGGQSCLPTFGHLFTWLSRVPLPLKWQVSKVEGATTYEVCQTVVQTL